MKWTNCFYQGLKHSGMNAIIVQPARRGSTRQLFQEQRRYCWLFQSTAALRRPSTPSPGQKTLLCVTATAGLVRPPIRFLKFSRCQVVIVSGAVPLCRSLYLLLLPPFSWLLADVLVMSEDEFHPHSGRSSLKVDAMSLGSGGEDWPFVVSCRMSNSAGMEKIRLFRLTLCYFAQDAVLLYQLPGFLSPTRETRMRPDS